MAKPVIHSPLAAHAPIVADGYEQREIFPLGRILIRGHADNAAFIEALQKTLGIEKTPAVNETITNTSGKHEQTLLGLGPNEWLLWTDDKQASKTLTALTHALANTHAAVVDVSDYYTTIRLQGAVVPQLLAYGCPLAIDKMAVGDCAQTLFAHANILIHRSADAKSHPVYDIQIRWSFAHYLWHYLQTAHHSERGEARGAADA